MDLEEVPDWAVSFAAFCARFDDLFVRSESRTRARKYLRGLLAGLERKTTWQLAEVVKDGTIMRQFGIDFHHIEPGKGLLPALQEIRTSLL